MEGGSMGGSSQMTKAILFEDLVSHPHPWVGGWVTGSRVGSSLDVQDL